MSLERMYTSVKRTPQPRYITLALSKKFPHFLLQFILSVYAVYTQINIIKWWFGFFCCWNWYLTSWTGEKISITLEVFSLEMLTPPASVIPSPDLHPRCWDSHISLVEDPCINAQIEALHVHFCSHIWIAMEI